MLSIIIPTFHERDNLELLFDRLAQVQLSLAEPLEVLVVDSASADGTAAKARELVGRLLPGRVIAHTTPTSLANAVLDGFRSARGDYLAVMDADLSHPPELLPKLLAALKAGSRCAVASRYISGGGTQHWPWRRRILSQGANWLVRPLVRITDATSGFFACPRSVVDPLALKPQGFKILLEVLVRGCVHPVSEVPYVFTDRLHGRSKLNARVLWSYLDQIVRLYWYRAIHPCRHV